MINKKSSMHDQRERQKNIMFMAGLSALIFRAPPNKAGAL